MTAVRVDQRGLIDKVLARYPGDFTVFRELLQNADDAKAKNVAIEFQLKTSHGCASNEMKLDLNSAKVFKWLVKNDGDLFQKNDWEPAGNPDEQKIGAFGVGFFSVFSVTDKPIVKSNGKMVSFYWQEDEAPLLTCMQLVAKDIVCDRDEWTVIEMELKQESTAARIFELTRFLVTSMTFLANVECITIWRDGTELSRLTKTRNKASQSIDIRDHMLRSSPGKTMTVASVDLICMCLLHLSKSAKL
ncbi:histidine kinase-like ATPase [Suillus paluster]|uniref:histidine kinase-like ATPase n=1 Tax=Suillus paluster TaxID=48578 RepID=UPI001B86D4B2|nr:histidine kinase-like ATPase [Suillus paluster]KAG1724396.1 histidine kinase-like ATPase [Suillus paluster]